MTTGRRHCSLLLALALLVSLASAANPGVPTPWEPPPSLRFREILPVDPAADAALGAGFEFLHTDHFSIAHRGDVAGARYRGEILESLYLSFALFFAERDVAIEQPSALLSVVLFPTREAFLAHTEGLPRATTLEGVYVPTTNRAYFFDSVQRDEVRQVSAAVRGWDDDLASLRREIEALPPGTEVTLKRPNRPSRLYTREAALREIANESRRLRNESGRYREGYGQVGIEAMSHEGAHLLSFNLGILPRAGPTPLCIVEGLATFFEPSRHGYLLEPGAIHGSRLESLRKAHATRGPIALDTLLVEDDLFRHDDTASQAYDEAWSLLHFLAMERADAFTDYLSRLRAPGSDDLASARRDTFVRAFGALPDVERAWRAHVASLGPRLPGSDGASPASR